MSSQQIRPDDAALLSDPEEDRSVVFGAYAGGGCCRDRYRILGLIFKINRDDIARGCIDIRDGIDA